MEVVTAEEGRMEVEATEVAEMAAEGLVVALAEVMVEEGLVEASAARMVAARHRCPANRWCSRSCRACLP